MFDLEKLVRPNIWELKPYSSARDEYSSGEGVFLDANENPYGDLNRYPDPYQKTLKKRLAEYKEIDSDRIFIGNGSDEVIDLLYRIFCEPGKDKALTFSPTYGMYQVSADINNINLIEVPLNKDFDLDLQEFELATLDDSIKLVFICSPNNPTANSMNVGVLRKLIESFNGIVVIDEAYIDFSPKSSWLTELAEFQNLIVMQTFSKAWGLAAARLGVAYASSEIIQLLNKVKPPYNVSTMNQESGVKALENIIEAKADIAKILREKEVLTRNLTFMDLVTKIYPSDANFLLIEVKDANAIYKILVDRKIIIRNRDSVVNNCLRITVGTAEENHKLLKTLKEIEL